uniref:Cullin-5 n=1 Tax=Caenorhabditis japonica TaxID=281687 RepID=A0A8R1DNJ8_CAEJA
MSIYEIESCLQRLYRLIRQTRTGIDTVLKCIDSHIRTEGLNDMRNNAESLATDPEKYVQQLLQMFEKFSSLVREGFCDDARLLTARDKAFRAVVNDSSIFKMEMTNKKGRTLSVESKCAELLANYCDLLLRKTQLSKKLTSEEIDEKLNQVLLVLKYVENKDVFMRFHRAHLSRRLILEMSADQEKEETMVTRLRECGMPSDAVNKLSRMLQDIELNKDMNSLFKKSLVGTNNNKSIADSINVKVLNGGAWGRGSSEMIRFSLPRELEDFVPEMEAFYKKQHNGRKLCWMHHWSSGTMVFGTANGGRFDLEITTFQMAVLFCFNDRAHEKISLETLRLATELPDAELNRTLLSLVAYPKMRSQILTCDVPTGPNGQISARDFTDSTKFSINHDFHLIKNGRVQQRGKVNLIGRLQLSLEANAEKEHESIVALREFRVQEGIVKIMKMRKQITLAQLTMELVEILKPLFIPNRKIIKEQIDWLIENKYMERRPDDISTFVYLA